MATIAENLQTIQNIKQNIKTAIENKGVDMTNTPFTEYSTKINEIATGGGGSSTFVVPDGMKFSYSTISSLPEGAVFLNVSDASYMFNECRNLVSIPSFNTINTTNMKNMFTGCAKLQNVPYFNTHNVTSMQDMFSGCTSLQSIPLLDTVNVKNMGGMFRDCKNVETFPLLDTHNVTDMGCMFLGCTKITTIPLLDTSNTTQLGSLVFGCSNLTSIPQLNTSNTTGMNNMFYSCSKLITIPQLDTTKVTNMSGMFYGCSSLQSIPLLECGKVTSMGTFFGYSNINTLTELGGFKDLKISITSCFLERTPNLTVDSLLNVINNVYDLTGNGLSGQTLKFGNTNLNKLTEEQVAIATAKGWTLTA